MKSEEIYQALKKRGHNASTVACALGVRPQSVAGVIRAGRGSERIAHAIALACDSSLEEIFPFYKEKAERALAQREKILELSSKLSGEFA